MMPLERLMSMDNKQVQDWLKKVDGNGHVKTLVTALLGAGETVRDRVFDNMSQKAAAVLKDDIEKHHKKHVNPAEIIKAGRKLEELF